MAASATLLRLLLALCVLAAPALAVGAGSGTGCVKGEVPTCKGVNCCPGYTCGFTSVGGGFFCLKSS